MEKKTLQNRDYDLEMAKYIWRILSSQTAIVMSWGVDVESIRVIKSGIEFHVNGFKHTGKVRIALNEGTDLFVITLIPDSGEKQEIIEDVFLDMLVRIIDEHIEKTDDYEKRVHEAYSIS